MNETVQFTKNHNTLIEQYKIIVKEALITSCGLDMLFFADDRAAGHVDTTRHTRESGEFINKKNQQTYENRGVYDSHAYHRDDTYINTGRQIKKQRKVGEVVSDIYTGNDIAPHEKINVDHKVAAKNIHDDKARAGLAEISGIALANQDTNLGPTLEIINKSKGKKTTEEFAHYLTEKRTEFEKKISELKGKEACEGLTDAERKALKRYDTLIRVDPELVRQEGDETQKAIAGQVDYAYYTSKKFHLDTTKAALKSGAKMAVKQAIGIILLEISTEVSRELPAILNQWQNAPTWRQKLDMEPVAKRMVELLSRAWKRVQMRATEIFRSMGEGFLSGIISELTTVIINIFQGTWKSIMRLLRTLWSSLIKSAQVLAAPAADMTAEQKADAVLRILSLAVGGALQPVVAELLAQAGLNKIPIVGEILAQFAGVVVGGGVSVTLLYALDHSPVARHIVQLVGQGGQIAVRTWQQIAALTGEAWHVMQQSYNRLSDALDSPTANLAVFVMSPPLGTFLWVKRRFDSLERGHMRLEHGQQEIKEQVARLETTVNQQLDAIDGTLQQQTALLELIAQQNNVQYAALHALRHELQQGLAGLHEEVRRVDTTIAARELRELTLGLQKAYRRCIKITQTGAIVHPDDFHTLREGALQLARKAQDQLTVQTMGAPARLPLFSTLLYAFTLEMEARTALGQDVIAQRGEIIELGQEIDTELRVLTQDATLWQLACERSWLLAQYINLHRSIRIAALHTDGNGLPSLISAGNIGIWDDGLDDVRTYLMATTDAGHGPDRVPLDTLDIQTRWRQWAGVPRGFMPEAVKLADICRLVGIPENFHLSPDAARRLILEGRSFLDDARRLYLATSAAPAV